MKAAKLKINLIDSTRILLQATTACLLMILTLFSAGLSHAQTPLQYQLNQQGAGNCPGTPVSIGISTGVGISTNVITSVSGNTALCGGNIGNDGGNNNCFCLGA